MKSLFKYSFTVALVMAFALLLNVDNAIAQDQNVVDVITSDEENTLFAELLQETDMPEVLSQQEQSFTILVPEDDAIESLDTSVEELKQNPEQLQTIVRNHLYQGELASEEVEQALNVNVTVGDNSASNGVVHTIDEVIQQN